MKYSNKPIVLLYDADEGRLDLLVNNAGVYTTQRSFTEDGFEIHFGVNHLGRLLRSRDNICISRYVELN